MNIEKFPNLRDFLSSNNNVNIIFSITEPDSNSNTSAFKLGTVIKVCLRTLKIQLREDFIPLDETEEKALMEKSENYQGKGFYVISLEEMVEVFVEIKN